MLTIFDYGIGVSRKCTQDDIDRMQEALLKFSTRSSFECNPPKCDEMNFNLAIYPNRMRDDGVFVAEAKEIAPYSGLTNIDGTLAYPSLPDTPWRIGVQLPHQFAYEIVRRWNSINFTKKAP